MTDLNMNGLPVPLADIKDMDDCIIQGMNIILSNEEIVTQWDAKVRRRIAGKLSVCLNEKVFEDVLKDYLRILKEQARNFREKNVLKDKISSHLKVFHLLCHSSKDMFISTYLDYMENILLVLCNLELDVVRHLKKNRMGKEYNKTVKRVARRLIDNLSINLHYNEKRIFHVLLKLEYKHEQAWKDVMHIVYSHYLINLPVTDKSNLSFCRYYLVFQRWKNITDKDKHQVMDKIMFVKFNLTPDSITSSKTLKSILMPSTESVVDLVDVLTNGQQVAVNAYFKYIDEKSEDDEIRIPQAIELDSDDEDMPVSLFEVNERDERLNGTVKAESHKPVESAHYVEVPSDNGQIVCVIDDDSDIEEVTVLTNKPRQRKSSKLVLARPVLSFLDSISLPDEDTCDKSSNIADEATVTPSQTDIPILTAFIDSVRRNRTLITQDSESSEATPLPEKTSDVVCQTTDADSQTQEKEPSEPPEKQPVCQCSCKSLSVESNAPATKPNKNKDLRTVEIQTDNLESFSYFCGMVTPPSDRTSDENSPESMENIHDTELPNNHTNNRNIYTYIRRDSFSETSSQNHYESDVDTHLGVCEMSTQIDGFDPPEPQEKEKLPEVEPQRSPEPPEQSTEPPKSTEPPDTFTDLAEPTERFVELSAQSSIFSEAETTPPPEKPPECPEEPQRSPEAFVESPTKPQEKPQSPEPLPVAEIFPEQLPEVADVPETQEPPEEPSESEQQKESAQELEEETEYDRNETFGENDLETEIELHDETLADLTDDDDGDRDDDDEGYLLIDERSQTQEQQIEISTENINTDLNNIIISENPITSENDIENGEICADIANLPIIIQADQVVHEFSMDLILDSYQLVPLTDKEGNEQNFTIIDVASEVEADTTTMEATSSNQTKNVEIVAYDPPTCKIQASVSMAEAISTVESPKTPRNGELARARRKSVADHERIIFTSEEKVQSVPRTTDKFELFQSELMDNACSGPVQPINRIRNNSKESYWFFEHEKRKSPPEGGSPISPPYENIPANDYKKHVESMTQQPEKRVSLGMCSPEQNTQKRKNEEDEPIVKKPRVNFGETNIKYIPRRKKRKNALVDIESLSGDSVDEFRTNYADSKLFYLRPKIAFKMDTQEDMTNKVQALKVTHLLSSILFEQRMKAESSCIMKRVDYKKDTGFTPNVHQTPSNSPNISSMPLPPSGYVPPLVAAKSGMQQYCYTSQDRSSDGDSSDVSMRAKRKRNPTLKVKEQLTPKRIQPSPRKRRRGRPKKEELSRVKSSVVGVSYTNVPFRIT